LAPSSSAVVFALGFFSSSSWLSIFYRCFSFSARETKKTLFGKNFSSLVKQNKATEAHTRERRDTEELVKWNAETSKAKSEKRTQVMRRASKIDGDALCLCG
jgi:hypothetical protein